MTTEHTATLSSRTVAVINAAARVMYPHDAVCDEVYARVGDKLAATSRDDPTIATKLEEGAVALEEHGAFSERSAEEQLELLKAIERSDFFEIVRTTAVVEVYSDPRTWEVVGYEGPSFDKGGYLQRGFNDLDWLPDPEPAS